MKKNKFSAGLVIGAKKDKTEESAQQKLKQKHNIENENIIVVEKSNITKNLLDTVLFLMRAAAQISLVVCAAIGIVALIYPNIRAELFLVFKEMLNQMKNFI